MLWDKELGAQEIDNLYGYLNIIGLFAIAFSFILQRPLLFLIGAILFLYVFVSKSYDKRIGNKLRIENKKHTIRMFVNRDGEIKLYFRNDSILPIRNGQLTLLLSNKVDVKNVRGKEVGEDNIKYVIPISIVSRGTTTVLLKVAAKARGVVHLKNMELKFPHFVHFQPIFLRYIPVYQTDIIIYPEPIGVGGLQETFLNTNGDQKANFSPYEDMLNPIGTRDYVSSDPFNRINWKASVRKQNLQTKVLEKTRDNTWIIVVNLTESSRLGNSFYATNVEKLLSYVTFICQFAAKMEIAYEIRFNTRRNDRYYLGKGKEHVKGALDFLAHVNEHHSIIPFQNMLSRIDNELHQAKTIIVIGEVRDETLSYFTKWKRKGMLVRKVNETGHGATLDDAVVKVGDTIAQG